MLRRRRPADMEERSTIDLSAYASLWGDTLPYSPVAVSTTTALTHAASSACIDTLATSVSALPIDAVRAVDGRRVPVTPTPTLIASPSGMVTQDVWLYQAMSSALTDGNIFGEVTTYSSTGLPTSIEILDPEKVGAREVQSNGIATVMVSGERRALYPHGDIWHVPGPFPRPGTPFGDSPVARAKATIGSAVAARDFGGRFFGDGGHPGGLITSPVELTTEQAQGIKRAFLNATHGNREPAVLGADLSYTPLLVDPNDSQFIDLMRFCTEEACRFWRVPPSMVYAASSGQSVTYANVSQADLHYLKHSLEGHLIRLERALTALLPRPQFVRFNRDAFLRSDPIVRSEVVDRRLRNGTLTVNEARALEDEQPFGDPEANEPAYITTTQGAEPTPEATDA